MSDPDALFSSSPPLRLLVAEDDPAIGHRLAAFFTERDHDVDRVSDGGAAFEEITTLPSYHVVLLSVALPERNGFAVLREVRASGVDTPVILLSRRSAKKHTLRGFELGADDFVTKPFDVVELAARVRAVHRRAQNTRPDIGDTYAFSNTTIDFDEQTVTRNGTIVSLTDLEADLLKYLVRHRGRTVNREQILRDVWGLSGQITTRTIDRHISALRKKVEPDPDDPRHLQTVYGIGYKFVG